VEGGQRPAEFDAVTFREMQIILEGATRRDERQAWLAAQYAAFAYHNPKEMPLDPIHGEKQQNVSEEVAEEMAAIQRRVKLKIDMAKAGAKHGS